MVPSVPYGSFGSIGTYVPVVPVDLKPAGVAVCLLHPGYVKTAMTAGRGSVEPSAQLVARIEALSLETTGSFWHASGSPGNRRANPAGAHPCYRARETRLSGRRSRRVPRR